MGGIDSLTSARGVLVRTDAAELDVIVAGPAVGIAPFARAFEVTGAGTIVLDVCDDAGRVTQTAVTIPATHITAGKRYDVNFTNIAAASTATGVLAYT